MDRYHRTKLCDRAVNIQLDYRALSFMIKGSTETVGA